MRFRIDVVGIQRALKQIKPDWERAVVLSSRLAAVGASAPSTGDPVCDDAIRAMATQWSSELDMVVSRFVSLGIRMCEANNSYVRVESAISDTDPVLVDWSLL